MRKMRGVADLSERQQFTDGVEAVVRGDDSRVIVAIGDRGVGKTMCLDWAEDRARDGGCATIRHHGASDEPSVLMASLRQLESAHAVVIIDDAHLLTSGETDALVSDFRRRDGLSYVLAMDATASIRRSVLSRMTSIVTHLDVLTLELLSRESTVDLARQFGWRGDETAGDELHRETQGNPKLIIAASTDWARPFTNPVFESAVVDLAGVDVDKVDPFVARALAWMLPASDGELTAMGEGLGIDRREWARSVHELVLAGALHEVGWGDGRTVRFTLEATRNIFRGRATMAELEEFRSATFSLAEAASVSGDPRRISSALRRLIDQTKDRTPFAGREQSRVRQLLIDCALDFPKEVRTLAARASLVDRELDLLVDLGEGVQRDSHSSTGLANRAIASLLGELVPVAELTAVEPSPIVDLAAMQSSRPLSPGAQSETWHAGFIDAVTFGDLDRVLTTEVAYGVASGLSSRLVDAGHDAARALQGQFCELDDDDEVDPVASVAVLRSLSATIRAARAGHQVRQPVISVLPRLRPLSIYAHCWWLVTQDEPQAPERTILDEMLEDPGPHALGLSLLLRHRFLFDGTDVQDIVRCETRIRPDEKSLPGPQILLAHAAAVRALRVHGSESGKDDFDRALQLARSFGLHLEALDLSIEGVANCSLDESARQLYRQLSHGDDQHAHARLRTIFQQQNEPLPRRRRNDREALDRSIVQAVIAGKTNVQIAEQFFLSPNTVRNRLAKLYRQHGVGSRLDLAMKFATTIDEVAAVA